MLFFSSFPLRFVKLRGPSFVTSSLSPTVRSFVCGFLYILFILWSYISHHGPIRDFSTGPVGHGLGRYLLQQQQPVPQG